jgi:cytochrome c peroxidase
MRFIRDALLTFFTALPLVAQAQSPAIALSSRCPASFELTPDGLCQFRSVYEQFASASDHGGYKAQLPRMRKSYPPKQIDLGRILFFDPLLSGNGKLACASCHQPEKGFSDGLRTAQGIDGHPLSRKTPTLWNVGFLDRLFWDGRASSLEEQAKGPLFAKKEMGNTPEALEKALSGNPTYRALFGEAFDRSIDSAVTVQDVQTALAAFQTSLVSFNSRYDRYVLGDQSAMSSSEVQGMNVFRGFVSRCTQCHTPPLFTNGELAAIGSPKNQLGQFDIGAGEFSDGVGMRGAFKVPTLRNIVESGPYYQHAGQLAGLHEAVNFYNQPRGHALTAQERGKQKLHWHVHMVSVKLSSEDVDNIVAFLGALSDSSNLPARPSVLPSQFVTK